MWAFRKKPADLRTEERQVLRKLWKYAPKLKQAYDLRQQLTAIFEQAISKTVAQRKIQAWIEAGQEKWAEVLRRVLEDLGALVGGDHQLLYRPSQ